jgi:hypothetical protein
MADFLNPLISATAGLCGVFLGGWLADRREREKRRSDFVERQLSEFYGPLMILRKQLSARREFREKLEPAIHKVWGRLIPEMRRVGVDEQRISELQTSALNNLSYDDQSYLKDVFLPDFREMLRLFKEKTSLAEPSTLPHFETLVTYVDAWELFLQKIIDGAVAIELVRPVDAKLTLFYTDLEGTHERLRREVIDIQSRKGWSEPLKTSCSRASALFSRMKKYLVAKVSRG